MLNTVQQKLSTPSISELSVQNIRDSGEMLSKGRYKTTSGSFVIPLLSQLWAKKNYCERRNELSLWMPVALPNRHIHLYLFKLGYYVHALLSSVMYILSGENITAVSSTIRRRGDQNITQVDNRLDRARATYVRLLHISSMVHTLTNIHIDFQPNTHCSLAWLVAGRNTLGGRSLWSQTDCGTVQTV